ncbi:MAG: PspC domain-containing protein, partial [Chloroflexi bacterium]|nr:PspC domain-containing protein [Chloroflexota bacterium]
GVAGGLGDYLNVDPVLFRAIFAGLVIFGGAGLVLYVLGWLLIPEEGHRGSIAEGAIRRMVRRPSGLVALVVVVIAFLVVRPWRDDVYDSFFYVPPEIFWGLAIAFVGLVLMLLRDRPDAASAAAAVTPPEPGVAADGAATAPAPAVWQAAAASRAEVAPRERSPLGWFAVAAAFLAIGLLAVVDNVAAVRVVPGQYMGAGFLAIGAGLLVGAWWGRARLLIVLGILILPVAAVSAFLTVPLEGGFAVHEFRPEVVGEVRPEYRVVGGGMLLDLTSLEGAGRRAGEPIEITASVGAGGLLVQVPEDATVMVDGWVEGGRLSLFGRVHVGTGLGDHVERPGAPAGVVLHLRLEAGLGWIQVISGGSWTAFPESY